jgi:hypothetical protein
MRRDNLLKHCLVGFALALVIYLSSYAWIEHLRTRKGPWEVTFRTDAQGAPQVEVNQNWLHIRKVRFVFPDQHLSETNLFTTLVFDTPITNAPFGKIVYLDTTFLPGAIALGLFGHEVQLLPRVLLLDRREFPWQSDVTHSLPSSSGEKRGTAQAPLPRIQR